MRASRLSACLAAALLIMHLPGQAFDAAGLKTLFEQAWQRSPAGRSETARIEEAEALRAQSRSWLAAAPVLEHSRSERESETSLSAAVVLPSHAAARRALADSKHTQAVALLAKAKLDLAGELRTRFWDLAAAQALHEERAAYATYMSDLAAQVQRRIGAGELARADGLLAEQEATVAKITATQAQGALRAAQARLQQLTGSSVSPSVTNEPLAGAGPNPQLAAADAALQAATATRQAAHAARIPVPTVSVGMRKERADRLGVPERSVVLSLQLPLGSGGENRIAQAAALAQQEMAAAEREQLAQASAQAVELARQQLDDARAALDATGRRAASMNEYEQLIDKAHRLGERGLADLLRARSLAHEARLALRQQHIAVGRAHAEYNQAVGVLP